MQNQRDTPGCLGDLLLRDSLDLILSLLTLSPDIRARGDRARGGRSLQVRPVGGQDPDV